MKLLSALAVLLVLASPLVNALSPPNGCDCSNLAPHQPNESREMFDPIRDMLERRNDGADREKLLVCQSYCLRKMMENPQP
jgi:hypothetical protein